MKNLFKISIFCLAIVYAISSCSDKKEDEPVPHVPNGYVKIDGVKIELDTMYHIYTGDYGDYTHTYLLVNKTVAYNSWMTSLMGTSNGFEFSVKFSNSDILPPGDYVLDSTAFQPVFGKLFEARSVKNYNFFMRDGESVMMKYGGCTLKKAANANEYIIDGVFYGIDSSEYIMHYEGFMPSYYIDDYF